MTSPLRAELRNRLKVAMRDRDRQLAGGIRSALAALENAEAVPVDRDGGTTAASEHVAGGAVGVGSGEAPRRQLSDEEERGLVEREVAELRQSAATLAEAGQDERSAELTRIAETVEQLLDE
jgi:hypothetical protein